MNTTIKKLILEDVRCFEGRNEFNIRPITFLVGENSTGKSSMLGCYQVLCNSLSGRDVDFNGTFTDISRADSDQFKIGFEYDYQNKKISHQLTFIKKKADHEPVVKDHEQLREFSKFFSESFIPIQSRPPVVLKNLANYHKKDWLKIKDNLVQLKFKIPEVNFIHIGYGVSHIIPILVSIFNTKKNKTFLLQQPEVHLHPKIQAEISSFFIDSFKNNQHRFLIETHSEYMIDRTRIKIMNGDISPDDVSLIFLSHENEKVKVHNIKFDKQANMINVPPDYHNFFINEQNQLMGL